MLVALGACRAPAPHFPGGVDLELAQSSGGTLFVPVVVNGQPRKFVIDTGASITAVTPTTARELRLAATGDTMLINDETVALVANLRTLSVGTAHHSDVRVAIVALPAAKRIDERFDGILGLDILGQYDVVVDLQRHRLVLHPPGHVAQTDGAQHMSQVRFERVRNGLVQLTAMLDDNPPIPAILDLGSQHTVVNSAGARWLAFNRSGYINGWRPKSIRIGDFEAYELDGWFLPVSDLPMFAGWGYASTPAVLLGVDLFADRMLVLAYQSGTLFVSR